MSTSAVDTFLTLASPLFTTECIQPEFSSFFIFLNDHKLKQAVHTMPEVAAPIQNIIMILYVSKMNANKEWIPAHAQPPATNLLPSSGARRPRDPAYDVTVKPPITLKAMTTFFSVSNCICGEILCNVSQKKWCVFPQKSEISLDPSRKKYNWKIGPK